jgi:hypothetical protein
MAHAIATQLLVWETVIGERDADFNHVSTGGKDAVKSVISSGILLKVALIPITTALFPVFRAMLSNRLLCARAPARQRQLNWNGTAASMLQN